MSNPTPDPHVPLPPRMGTCQWCGPVDLITEKVIPTCEDCGKEIDDDF